MPHTKRTVEANFSGFLIRPSVLLAMPWTYICAQWFIGILMTCKFTVRGSAEHAEFGDVVGLLSSPAFAAVSVINALFVAAFLADARVASRLPSYTRRPQLVAVALALVNIALLQWGAFLARGPLGAA